MELDSAESAKLRRKLLGDTIAVICLFVGMSFLSIAVGFAFGSWAGFLLAGLWLIASYIAYVKKG